VNHDTEASLATFLSDEGRTRPAERARFAEHALSDLLTTPQLNRGRDDGYDFRLTNDMFGPILVQVKILTSTSFTKNRLNQVSSLVSSSVFARRNSKAKAAVVAIILLSGQPRDSVPPNAVRMLADDLLVGHDGIGFEAVFFAFANSANELGWLIYGKADGTHHNGDLYSTQHALSLIKNVVPNHDTHHSLELPDEPEDDKRILLVADEWKSGRGGISTLNRELATALAAEGADVVVMLPEASEEDRTDASNSSVVLAYPARIPGLTDRESLLLRPVLPVEGWIPDAIIGHGRILGPHAAAQKVQYFDNAKRIHLVHMDAEQLESAKEQVGSESRMASSESRRATEKQLAVTADYVFGIGPLLSDTISDEFIGEQDAPSVQALIPGLRGELDLENAFPPARNRVLFIGRADDFHSKGIDLLAEAMIQVSHRWRGLPQQTPELVIRGVPDESADAVKNKLDTIVNQRFRFVLRGYSSDSAELNSDLAQSRVLVMPSRHEGFGLAAWEGIAAGIPVLVTTESGIAQYLQSQGIDTPRTSILPIRDGANWRALDKWVEALEWIFDNPDVARKGAFALRTELRAVATWRDAAQSILNTLS
jgi:D-inositol-3-phosphate glycosyltransferase